VDPNIANTMLCWDDVTKEYAGNICGIDVAFHFESDDLGQCQLCLTSVAAGITEADPLCVAVDCATITDMELVYGLVTDDCGSLTLTVTAYQLVAPEIQGCCPCVCECLCVFWIETGCFDLNIFACWDAVDKRWKADPFVCNGKLIELQFYIEVVDILTPGDVLLPTCVMQVEATIDGDIVEPDVDPETAVDCEALGGEWTFAALGTSLRVECETCVPCRVPVSCCPSLPQTLTLSAENVNDCINAETFEIALSWNGVDRWEGSGFFGSCETTAYLECVDPPGAACEALHLNVTQGVFSLDYGSIGDDFVTCVCDPLELVTIANYHQPTCCGSLIAMPQARFVVTA
jgi:hypothetical protein